MEGIATLAILLATLFWGMTFSFVKDAVSILSPFNFLFWRFAFAGLLLLLIFHKKIIFSQPKLLLQGFWLGLFLGGTVIFQTIGLRYTTASTASFITGLTVILVAIASCIIDRRWPSINIIVAILLAVVGIGLITITEALTINVGDVWIMMCAICFATYILLAGTFSKSGQALTLNFIQMLVICVLSAILDVSFHSFVIPNAWHLWIAILFCAIFASVIAFNLQLHFQQYVSPTKTAIIFATEPIFATITAMIYLGEHLSMRFLIGAGLIFAAMLLSELKLQNKIVPQD